jgi:hypothetical protein
VNERSQCSDVDGNVFITQWGSDSQGGKIVEYAHDGASPINTLTLPVFQKPQACSVDPTTGNVAAVAITAGGPDNISIWVGGQGNPQTYSDSLFENYGYCAYDNDGNLYIDGTDTSGRFIVATLRKGSSTFTTLSLKPQIDYGFDLQWRGKYLVIGALGLVYQVQLSGSSGKVVRTIHLRKDRVTQFWIEGHLLAAAVPVKGRGHGPKVVALWRYPQGGRRQRRYFQQATST